MTSECSEQKGHIHKTNNNNVSYLRLCTGWVPHFTDLMALIGHVGFLESRKLKPKPSSLFTDENIS